MEAIIIEILFPVTSCSQQLEYLWRMILPCELVNLIDGGLDEQVVH